MKYSKLAQELKSMGWNLKSEIESFHIKEFVNDILLKTNEELDTTVNNFKELAEKNYKEYERVIQELKQTLVDTQQNRDRILENDREILNEKVAEIDSLRNIIRNNDQEYQKKMAKLNHENEQLIAKNPASKVLKMQERILELELDQKATKEREELRERTMVALAEKNAEYAKEIKSLQVNNISNDYMKDYLEKKEKNEKGHLTSDQEHITELALSLQNKDKEIAALQDYISDQDKKIIEIGEMINSIPLKFTVLQANEKLWDKMIKNTTEYKDQQKSLLNKVVGLFAADPAFVCWTSKEIFCNSIYDITEIVIRNSKKANSSEWVKILSDHLPEGLLVKNIEINDQIVRATINYPEKDWNFVVERRIERKGRVAQIKPFATAKEALLALTEQ